MDADHILGIAVILCAYALTLYLLIKSLRIVNTKSQQDSEHTRDTEPGPEPEDQTGSSM